MIVSFSSRRHRRGILWSPPRRATSRRSARRSINRCSRPTAVRYAPEIAFPAAETGCPIGRLERECLHQYRAHGKFPLSVGTETDGLALGQGDIPFLGRTVGPQRHVHVVGNQSRNGSHRLRRGEKAGLGKQPRKGRPRLGFAFRLAKFVDIAVETGEEHFVRRILSERRDFPLRTDDFQVVGHLLAVVAQRPNVSRVVVGIEIRAVQFGQFLAAIDDAADDALADAAAVIDDRIDEFFIAFGQIGAEIVKAFLQIPAVIARL